MKDSKKEKKQKQKSGESPARPSRRREEGPRGSEAAGPAASITQRVSCGSVIYDAGLIGEPRASGEVEHT